MPSVPWIHLHNTYENQQMNPVHTPGLQGQLQMLSDMTKSMNSSAAYDIGHIHRYLTQPLIKSSTKTLETNLSRMNLMALAFVCTDLECLPSGKFGKAKLIKQLVQWVCIHPFLIDIHLFMLI
jgi:hypothetical protein